MSKLYYKLANWATCRYLDAQSRERSPALALVVFLGLQRKWAEANGIDFDRALEVSESIDLPVTAEELAK